MSDMNFTVTFDDPRSEFAAFYPGLTSNLLAAAQRWGEYFTSNASIQVELGFDAGGPAIATGGSVTSVFVDDRAGFDVYQSGAAAEIISGSDPNRGEPDIRIDVSPFDLTHDFWLDPTPADRTDPAPAGQFDAISVLLHELAHGFGFIGFRDDDTGQLPADFESVFDSFVTSRNGLLFFNGPSAVAVYGGPVPLAIGSPYHYGNDPPNPGSNLLENIEGQFASRGVIRDIAPIDIAIMRDLGLPINDFVGFRSDDVITGDARNNVLKGLEGSDILNGSLGNDTLDGGTGRDTAVFSARRVDTAVSRNATGYAIAGPDGGDTVVNVERLQFADSKVSLDLGTGDAGGMTVRLIGAAFDRPNLVPSLVGTGIRLFDQGRGFLEVAQMAINTDLFLSLATSHSNADFVNAVYRNVVGALPSVEVRDSIVRLLQGSGGTMTQAELLTLAAYTPENAVNIDLVGLQTSGVNFV
jgi:hypothetical protein